MSKNNRQHRQQQQQASKATTEEKVVATNLQAEEQATEQPAAPTAPEETTTAPAATQEQTAEQTGQPAAKEPEAPAAPVAPVAPAVAEPAPAPFSVLGTSQLQAVDAYITAMNPRRPIGVEDILKNQIGLYRAITTIINRVEDDFDAVFTALLKKFEDNKTGALHESYVFRGFENIPLAENDRKAFQRLLNLIKVGAPVRGREYNLKQIDFTATLKFGLTEPGRQRVLAYFQR